MSPLQMMTSNAKESNQKKRGERDGEWGRKRRGKEAKDRLAASLDGPWDEYTHLELEEWREVL